MISYLKNVKLYAKKCEDIYYTMLIVYCKNMYSNMKYKMNCYVRER